MSLAPIIYNLFPRLYGPIDRWIADLPRIAAMGFDWVFVNPIQFAGFSGSLYAIKDHDRLNPLFAEQPGQTLDDAISALVAACDRHGLGLMLDLVISHVSKDSGLIDAHPAWVVRAADGQPASPGAVDPDDPTRVTEWGDLAKLDYRDPVVRGALAAHWREVAARLAALGVRGFRCDAAYQVPGEVWTEVIAGVRRVRSEALFAAETLGCRLDEVAQLRPAGFDFLFNSSKWWDFDAPWLLEQYAALRSQAPSIAFAESHDTERLGAEIADDTVAERLYRQRTLFAACFSSGVLMPVGFEYGFRTKLDVVATTPADWEAARFDLTSFVTAVNRMKAVTPVLREEGPQRRVAGADGRVVGLVRSRDRGPGLVVTLVNRDLDHTRVIWPDECRGVDPVGLVEITPGAPAVPFPAAAPIGLGPGAVRVFSRDP